VGVPAVYGGKDYLVEQVNFEPKSERVTDTGVENGDNGDDEVAWEIG